MSISEAEKQGLSLWFFCTIRLSTATPNAAKL